MDQTGELTERVAGGLARLGGAPPADAPRQLARLAQRVAEWGARINLSGHRTPEQICDRLILDAAALEAELPQAGSVADLGSGAGFPGLPIAILRPDAQVWLVDSRQRRHHFQRAVVRELGLPNARPLLGRIEALEPVPCEIALAQAVAPAAEVARLIQPWVQPGGWLGIPATADARPPALEDPGLGELRELEYEVPGGLRRKIWLIQRR